MKIEKIESTKNTMLFVSKVDCIKSRFYQDDFKQCYQKLGEWVIKKTKGNKFISILNTFFKHSFDYNLGITYLQLEVIYEIY